jgi:hypothetical protein
MSMPTAAEATDIPDGGGSLDPAALFALVWEALAEVLGTAATAAIIRRAAGRAAAVSPELVDVVIRRENLEYRYALPHAWSQPDNAVMPGEQAPVALKQLIAETGRVLMELTGTVFVGQLEQIPQLRARGLLWRPEGAN